VIKGEVKLKCNERKRKKEKTRERTNERKCEISKK
jgi:hypothetical protein